MLPILCFLALSYTYGLVSMSNGDNLDILFPRPVASLPVASLNRHEQQYFAEKTPRQLINLWSTGNSLLRARIELFTSTITSVDLSHESIIESGLLEIIQKLYPALEKLNISDKPYTVLIDPSFCSYCGDELTEQIARLFPNLTTLVIRDSLITNAGLKALCLGCPNLQHLDISSNCLSDGEEIALLKNLKNLTSLNIAHNFRLVSRETILILRELTQLESLDISQTRFANELLQKLFEQSSTSNSIGLVNLRTLHMRGLALEPLTSSIIEHVMRLPKITALHTLTEDIDSSGLEKLKTWKKSLTSATFIKR